MVGNIGTIDSTNGTNDGIGMPMAPLVEPRTHAISTQERLAVFTAINMAVTEVITPCNRRINNVKFFKRLQATTKDFNFVNSFRLHTVFFWNTLSVGNKTVIECGRKHSCFPLAI